MTSEPKSSRHIAGGYLHPKSNLFISHGLPPTKSNQTNMNIPPNPPRNRKLQKALVFATYSFAD